MAPLGRFRFKCRAHIEGVGAIRLCLEPSDTPPRVSSDVAGRTSATLADRSFANDVFGRPSWDGGWINGGRMPDPTLAENEDVDVFLETAPGTLRYVCEKEDDDILFRAWIADAIAGLTGAMDRGAAMAGLIGSPALSTNVFLFGAGSGTATDM